MKRAGSWVALVVCLIVALACESAQPGDDGAAATQAQALGGVITLVSGSSTNSGYDFSTQTYKGNSGGDFYFGSGQFWSNNTGQRGLVSVGACSAIDNVMPLPTTGYGIENPTATVGNCYVSLTHNDERDYIVFRVDGLSATDVVLTWKLVPSGKFGATLAASGQTSGYDFSTRTYKGSSGGDFYFSAGKFWANNPPQRGVISRGACSSVDSVTTLPTTGYSPNGVTATAGNCYVALTHEDERDHVVFRVDALTATSATLTWKIVPSGKYGATLVSGSSTNSGYDFSTRTYKDITGGDLYFQSGQFWANNSGMRGLVSVGACSTIDSVTTIPTSGYGLSGVATAGNCYVALTHNDERDYVVFKVEALTSTTATLTWKLVVSGKYGATLTSGSSTQGGYDFVSRTYKNLSGGDLYFLSGQFWANNPPQRGLVSVGACTSVDTAPSMPQSGYSPNGVTATAGNCYVALTRAAADYVVFRVDALTATTVTITWKLVFGVTLTAGSATQSGYDFSTRTLTGQAGGDFYFASAKFWTNQPGQRGVVSAGACANIDSVGTLPANGYATSVSAVIGRCYVARAHNEEHASIIFRVEALSATTATLTWKLVDDCHRTSNPRQNLNCWLTQNPNVSQYLVWEKRVSLGVTSLVPWSQWTNAQRDELQKNVAQYTSIINNGNLTDPDPLADPPFNQETLANNVFPQGVLSTNDAWRLYVKTIAMSLAIELKQYVPWSVVSYEPRSLASLFDSRHSLSYTWSGRPPGGLGVPTPQAEGYVLIANSYDYATHVTFAPSIGYVVPAPPDKALKFIRAKSLIGTTKLQTIVNTLDWARRLWHFRGTRDTLTFQQTWQYRGPAPVTRTIDTTVDTGSSDPNLRHLTAGCHGTSGFFNSVLRTINIPVDVNETNGHSLTRFMSEGVYLSHADDPYLESDIYDFPVSNLLISEATFTTWFNYGPPVEQFENIGRGNPEAMIKALSGMLQDSFCKGPTPAHIMSLNGFVTRPTVYSQYNLEHLPYDPTYAYPGEPTLWGRLAAKVQAGGGCDVVVPALLQQQAQCEAITPISERPVCFLSP